MTPRQPQAGVTLIEMLAALSVAALVGVAAFTLLDGVATRDAQIRGRLDQIAERDRAFHLLNLDTTTARGAEMTSDNGLMLSHAGLDIIWRAGQTGLTRHLLWPDGTVLIQPVLTEAADLLPHPKSARAALLVLRTGAMTRTLILPEPYVP